MIETHNEDTWITVQDWTPTPPLEDVLGLVSAELLEDMPRPYGTHWMEGKSFYRPGWLLVMTWRGPSLGGWTWTPVEVAGEPGVLDLPEPILDALRAYAMDWPLSAHPLHWHERVGVPVITRIRQVARLLQNWREAWDRYPGERGEDDWTAPKMAHAGLVEPDPNPAVVAAKVAAKWPALWGKYGCDAALNHCSAGMTDRPT